MSPEPTTTSISLFRYGVLPRSGRRGVFGAFLLLVALVLAAKTVVLAGSHESGVTLAYSIVVGMYVLSRFLLAAFYRKPPIAPAGWEPTVSIVVPAMNEGAGIVQTLQACLDVDYPAAKVQIIAVDDGSTDDTLQHMRDFTATTAERIELVALPENRGKRAAMAEGVRRATGELFVFIDSDSLIDDDGLRRLVPYFHDDRVGAVCGHTDVTNVTANMLTRMQAARYFVAFRVYKAAEALFGCVTCCSGCFSGYRASSVRAVLGEWEQQSFLGVPSTFGDDRALTNAILRTQRVLYAPDAKARTEVPEGFRKFLRQQLRWKKSWLRENGRAAAFMWRKNPIMALSFYVAFLLPLLAPLVLARVFLTGPLIEGAAPVWYVAGLLVMAVTFGLFYRLHHRNGVWLYGVAFTFLYITCLVWQLPYALLTMRDNSWGTR